MKKLFACFFVAIVLTTMLPAICALNKEVKLNFVSNQQSAAAGDTISFAMSAAVNFSDRLSAFRIKVTFDASRFKYDGISAAGKTEDGEYKTYCSENEVTIIYLTSANGFLVMQNETIYLFELHFTVLDTAQTGETIVSAAADGFANDSVQPVTATKDMSASLLLTAAALPDCSLQYLRPDSGELHPAFQPEVMEYTMEVPYSVDRITLFAQAADSAATVRVSRKTLEKAGTSTLIKVTVKSEDGKVQRVYNVTVYRAVKSAVSQVEDVASSVIKGGAANTVNEDKKKNPSSAYKAGNTASQAGQGTVNTGTGFYGAVSTAGEPLTDNAVQTHHLIIKNNAFGAFLTGFLLCAAFAGGIVLVSRKFIKNKQQHYRKKRVFGRFIKNP